MKTLKILKQFADGTQLAIINPIEIVDNPQFEAIDDTMGYHDAKRTIPEAAIPSGTILKLMACKIDEKNEVGIFRFTDIQGNEITTFVAEKDVKHISGNINGIKA